MMLDADHFERLVSYTQPFQYWLCYNIYMISLYYNELCYVGLRY